MPKRTNPRAYERAAELIASGTWVVDPAAGVIISKVYGQPLRPGITGTGYRQVRLWIPELKKATNITLHRVIWEYVHGVIPPGMEVNHRDGDKSNNSISNLELLTPKENTAHAFRTGLRSVQRGEQCSWAKLGPDRVREIKARLARGDYQDDIAADFNISQTLVSSIKRGRSWGSVEGDVGHVQRPNRKRMTPAEVRKVLRLANAGVRQSDIARQMDISPSKVSMIVTGRAWRHVSGE